MSIEEASVAESVSTANHTPNGIPTPTIHTTTLHPQDTFEYCAVLRTGRTASRGRKCCMISELYVLAYLLGPVLKESAPKRWPSYVTRSWLDAMNKKEKMDSDAMESTPTTSSRTRIVVFHSDARLHIVSVTTETAFRRKRIAVPVMRLQ